MTKAEVVQCHRIKWHKNPISGHEWHEIIPINRWGVVGGTSLGETFKSRTAALEYAAFLNYSQRVKEMSENGTPLEEAIDACRNEL